MTPESQPPTKRRRLPFNPPRPRASPSAGPSSTNDASQKATKKSTSMSAKTSSASSKPRTSSSLTKRKPSGTHPSSLSSESTPRNRNRNRNRDRDRNRDDATEEENESEQDENRNSDEEGEDSQLDYMLAEIITHDKDTTDILSSAPTVPPKLLTRILAHHFQDPKTKLAKDANELVAKYVDVFVREALARAAYESSGGDAGREGTGGGGGVGDGFLEVEDLEKLAPQLILDF